MSPLLLISPRHMKIIPPAVLYFFISISLRTESKENSEGNGKERQGKGCRGVLKCDALLEEAMVYLCEYAEQNTRKESLFVHVNGGAQTEPRRAGPRGVFIHC